MKYSKSLFKSKFEIDNRFKTGVYSLYCKATGQYYIGSTIGKGGFMKRWCSHLYKFRKNKHTIVLQELYNKYGENSFFFEILEIFEVNNETVREREQYYIDLLQPELNICEKAYGCIFPERFIQPNSKAVLQYDLDGNFIKEYKSMAEAEEATGSDVAQALRALNHCNSTQSAGFQWRLKESDNYQVKIDKYKYSQSFEILCYDSNGDFIKEFPSILEASKELNLNTGNISRNINGLMHSCNGYFFKKKINDNYPQKINELLRIHKNQFCVDIEDLNTGKKYHFNSLREIPNKIMNRCTLRPYMKKGLTEFTITKKDKSKIFRFKITKL